MKNYYIYHIKFNHGEIYINENNNNTFIGKFGADVMYSIQDAERELKRLLTVNEILISLKDIIQVTEEAGYTMLECSK